MDLKNFVLQILAWVNRLAFILAAMRIDNESWIPFIICCISGIYLTTFAYANKSDWR